MATSVIVVSGFWELDIVVLDTSPRDGIWLDGTVAGTAVGMFVGTAVKELLIPCPSVWVFASVVRVAEGPLNDGLDVMGEAELCGGVLIVDHF